jgi:hypothetical protein
VPAPPNAAVRRFATLWSVSFAVKAVAVVLLLFVVFRLLGGY